jgi:hypothetical protein
MVAHAAQIVELIEGREGIRGAAVRAGQNDLAGDRQDRFRR